MKVMGKIVFGLLFFMLIGCAESDSTEIHSNEDVVEELVAAKITSIDDLKWIEGVWIDSITFSFRSPPTTYLEKWVYFPDSLTGKGMSIKGADTVVSELLLIREINGVINYIARPSGKAIIGFPLTSIKDNEVVFENQAHDFPQKINYSKPKGDSLVIRISGIIPQGERVVTFKMQEVSF